MLEGKTIQLMESVCLAKATHSLLLQREINEMLPKLILTPLLEERLYIFQENIYVPEAFIFSSIYIFPE